MSCSACGNKSRRPMTRTSGGQPVRQSAVGGNTQRTTGTARSRITGLKWKQ